MLSYVIIFVILFVSRKRMQSFNPVMIFYKCHDQYCRAYIIIMIITVNYVLFYAIPRILAVNSYVFFL